MRHRHLHADFDKFRDVVLVGSCSQIPIFRDVVLWLVRALKSRESRTSVVDRPRLMIDARGAHTGTLQVVYGLLIDEEDGGPIVN